MENEGQINCVSCGCTLVGPSGQQLTLWGHSHNLPVKHYPQFESDSENFKPRCQVCHAKLDEPDFRAISKFDDFDQLMEYRRKRILLAYNQWVSHFLLVGITDYNYINETTY